MWKNTPDACTSESRANSKKRCGFLGVAMRRTRLDNHRTERHNQGMKRAWDWMCWDGYPLCMGVICAVVFALVFGVILA